jgi:hypothetical protein
MLSSCSPDPEEAEQQSNNAQNQLKSITITVTSDLPISAAPAGGNNFNYLTLFTPAGLSSLSSQTPNHIGQNEVSQTFMGAPSMNWQLQISYLNWESNSGASQQLNICSNITIKAYADGVLFYNITKQMGGGTTQPPCPDGSSFQTNIIVPN